MKDTKLYKEHQDEMFGITSADELTEEDVDRIIARLLSCLPNNGKLYKYRSIEGQAFDYALEGLKDGYLWMANANTLNDDFDSTIPFNPTSDITALFEDIKKDVNSYAENIGIDEKTQVAIQKLIDTGYSKKLIDCYNKDRQEFDKDKLIQLLITEENCLEVARENADKILLSIDDNLKKGKETLTNATGSLVDLNKNNRQGVFVFSFSEDFDSDPMWALYASSNKGFCVVYDFNRIKNLPLDTKKQVIHLHKIIYRKEINEYSLLNLMRNIATGNKDKTVYKEINKEILTLLITKKSKWKNEKEWRILLLDLKDNKLFADIVSGLIIDKRVIETDNAKKLLELAKERGWSVKIRSTDVIGTKHVYKEISL